MNSQTFLPSKTNKTLPPLYIMLL